jgi:hypothetical protein
MGAHADMHLHVGLTKIIDELNLSADNKIAYTPRIVRTIAEALTVVRDCHKHLAEYEATLDGGPMDGDRVWSELYLENVYPLKPKKATA